MSSIVKAALILSAAIVVAASALGGIYTTTPAGAAYFVFVVNKWTGKATLCSAAGCRRLGPQPQPSPSASPSETWGQGDPIYTESAK